MTFSDAVQKFIDRIAREVEEDDSAEELEKLCRAYHTFISAHTMLEKHRAEVRLKP